MTDSLADILGNRSYNEPPEVAAIKKFVREKYKSDVAITIRDQQIIIVVQGAALAGTLRMHLHELKKLCQTEKRLVLRIR
jgi:hypothetical protein